MVRLRSRPSHADILLRIASVSSLLKTLFTVLCLIALVGSSFRPMPGPDYAVGSVDFSTIVPDSESQEEEEEGLFYSVYQVKRGDTISGIAESYGVSVDTIFSVNDIQAARSIQPAQLLKIPNMSGILYQAKSGDSVEVIAEKHGISPDRLIVTNRLMKNELDAGRMLFLPDAKLPSVVLREIAGDLFRWPVRGYITSWYSWRRDPFTGKNSFHNGIDIGVPSGTPVAAAMEGSVSEAGYSPIMGNYVMLRHPAGWQTLYAHLSSILVKKGQYVPRGNRVGLSGNTGYSTGPHLHFTVYKNGKSVNPINVLQ
ncbi:MAG: M23 family metallopeptidase [Spirochaetia bacterium]|jgi:murein DD-endopeptidase MepM/ murein hydrolase activator NlpD|nr:M23 family metallopeptidase [Spirochaetia bacterium]